MEMNDQNIHFILQHLQESIGHNAKVHGFHDGDINIPEKLALIHSEISEAPEAYRTIKGPLCEMYYTKTSIGDKPDGFMSELADAVIRCFDTSYLVNGDLGKAILEKMAYNVKRPHMHGKNC